MKLFQIFLIGLLIISLGATIYVATQRMEWEENYRTVTVAVDYQALVGLGATEATLAELARQGITALALGPQKLGKGEVEKLRELGVEPLFLLNDLYRYGAGDLESYLAKLARLGPRLIVFQNAGNARYAPGQLARIEKALRANHALVGLVEFTSSSEEAYLRQVGLNRFVRAHTIKPEELERLGLEETLARFQRAVGERNIRLVLVHPFEATLNYNLDFLERLTSGLRAEAFKLGLPEPPPGFSVTRPALILILLGPLSLALLALNRGWNLRLSFNLALLLLGIIVIIAGLYTASGPLTLIAAGATAVSVPVAAYLLLAPAFDRADGSTGQGLAAVLAFSTVALLGGLWIAAMLSRSDFFIKLEQFRGVKAALILPLLLVFLLHFARHGFQQLRHLLSRRPTWGELLMLLLGAAAILLVLLRSDNFSAIPGLEKQVRETLEAVLHARPRFKEFLIGHPLLLLWGAYGKRLGDYRVIVLTLGMIGQVSIINTFAHLHTPLLLSLLRTANGLMLGLMVGLGLCWLVRWGERLWQRSGS